MKKLFICVVIVLIFASLTLVACGGGGSNVYYEVDGSSLNESSWIKLSGGKWSDNDGESGKYKLDGDKITLLQEGEELMTGTLKDGTLELELWGIPVGTYRTKDAQAKFSDSDTEDKNESGFDNDTPSDKNGNTSNGGSTNDNNGGNGTSAGNQNEDVVTKTLSLYNLDGSITKQQVEVGKSLGTLPTPTRSDYRFKGWENLDGDIYTSMSVMPSEDLELYPLWEKSVSSYSDSFLSLSPARQGYKNESAYLQGHQYGAEKYLYVEITPEDLNGMIDTSNNFSLRNLKGLKYSVSAGYTAMWYQGNFSNPNGAQRFSLGYGSNIQLITVSDGGGTVQCTYLLDLYVLETYTVSLYKTLYDRNPFTTVRVLEGDSLPITVRPTTNGDLEFDRWIYYDRNTSRYKKFTYASEVTSDINIYQAYKPCTATVDTDGGSLAVPTVMVEPYMDYVDLPVPTKKDCDFLGWKRSDGTYFTNYRGSSQWNYYTSSTGTLTAAWKKRVMYYSFADDVLTILPTDYNAVYLENGTIDSMWYTVVVNDELIQVDRTNSADAGEEITIATLTDGKDGYTWLGWYEGEKKVSEGDSPYSFTMPAESKTYTAEWTYYTLTTETNLVGGGTYTLKTDEKVRAGNSVTLTASTNPGYTWVGWYDGETKVSEGTSPACTIVMPAKNKVFTAKWITCPVTLEKNISEAGTVSGVEGATAVGAEATITAITNAGYTWLGWYDGETKVSDGTNLTYTFTISAGNKTFTAKFELCSNHTPNDNCICVKCGAIAHTPNENGFCEKCGFKRNGKYIYFGEYPQTLKATDVEILDVTDTRGYYLGSDGEYYAEVIGRFSGITFTTGSTVTNGTIYYFKVEPIKWRIVNETNNEILVLCDSIVECDTSGGDRNYAQGSIRRRLNNHFYQYAFSDQQKQLIILDIVDNSASSTGYTQNPYACQNTEDHVFLLSYNEARSMKATDRQMQVSDYCRALGTSMDYYGNGSWWLRSPTNQKDNVWAINHDGSIESIAYTYIDMGVVPAIRIKL